MFKYRNVNFTNHIEEHQNDRWEQAAKQEGLEWCSVRRLLQPPGDALCFLTGCSGTGVNTRLNLPFEQSR